MKGLVEVLAKALVDQPDEVSVVEVEGETNILVEIKVAPEDVGKIIGKQGRIIRAIRTLAKSVAQKQRKNVSVELWQ
ncbi:MAG: KH domain-containing protein [Bacillota bacterium]